MIDDKILDAIIAFAAVEGHLTHLADDAEDRYWIDHQAAYDHAREAVRNRITELRRRLYQDSPAPSPSSLINAVLCPRCGFRQREALPPQYSVQMTCEQCTQDFTFHPSSAGIPG